VLFVSNNSSVRLADVVAKLVRFDIPAEGDVLTSALAAARLVEPGERVLLCAGDGAAEALADRGALIVDDGLADVVVVGFHRTFSYEGLRRAAVAVRNGARLVATNDDATYPTPDGPIPGGGAILAAVETGAGTRAVVAGKPYEPMAALVRDTLGENVSRAVMVGDRPDTDGRFAVALGCSFALVLSGVTRPQDLPVDPSPNSVHVDLASLVDDLLAT
jgi:HAD superfamily hydrolase (TIGR01450 family)